MSCQLLTKKLIIKGINRTGQTVLLGHIVPYTMELVYLLAFRHLPSNLVSLCAMYFF